jgi:transcriptional regulator with XRE-family HTH domain
MERLKQVLRERGMTQLQLAVAAKISPYRLSRLFHKRARLRRRDRRRIAGALGIRLNEIFPLRTRRARRDRDRRCDPASAQ